MSEPADLPPTIPDFASSTPRPTPAERPEDAVTRSYTDAATPHSGASSSGAPPAAGRYRPLRFHAKGGPGEVYLALDTELHRQVALKRIQHDYAGDPATCRRFLLEAEITGQLEHPGIVPVYGLVRDEAGEPCYAMRFIEGESLRDAI